MFGRICVVFLLPKLNRFLSHFVLTLAKVFTISYQLSILTVTFFFFAKWTFFYFLIKLIIIFQMIETAIITFIIIIIILKIVQSNLIKSNLIKSNLIIASSAKPWRAVAFSCLNLLFFVGWTKSQHILK